MTMIQHTPTKRVARVVSEDDEGGVKLQVIRKLNKNDVLFGRGTRFREHSGSKQFREICQLFIEEYSSTTNRETKNIVSYKIINAIGALDPPGRFLQIVSEKEAKKKGLVHSNGDCDNIWQEMSSSSALRKVKQSLRDITRPTHANERTDLQTTSSENTVGVDRERKPAELENLSLPQSVHLISAGSSSDTQSDAETTIIAELDHVGHKKEDHSITMPLQTPLNCTGDETLGPRAADQLLVKNETSNESDTAEDFWEVAAMEHVPKFTEEQAKNERESLTDVERVSILRDLFGKLDVGSPAKKRVKRPAPCSIDSLLKEMRNEIDRFPAEEKSSVLEAESKADSSEFSDDRLKQFLFREDMDPQRAAQRYVTYWSERRRLFGPEKYLMNMTLDGALRDDIVTLKACIFTFIPRRDASGRSLIYMEQSRRNPDEHTLDSVMRGYWYVLETVTRENWGKEAVFVVLNYDKNLTIWDYDQRMQQRVLEFEHSIFPVRLKAVHTCYLPRIALFILKPVVYAVLDKRERQRSIIHDATGDELCELLARDYGLFKDMLPTEMGGTVKLREWIARQEGVGSEGCES